jgi:GT2 family glycosyltransferase
MMMLQSRERHPLTSVYNGLADIEWDTPIGETKACGGDALMRAEAFEAVGGFRSSLIAGEEPELCVRLREAGWRIWRLDAEMTLHDMAMSSFGQWWTRAVRAGHGMTEVWWLHRQSPQSIWGRETASNLIWTGFLPITVILAATIHPFLLTFLTVYPLQVVRIALKKSSSSAKPVTYALFTMVGKFAALQGVLRLCWTRLSGKAIRLIEYK